MEKKTQKDFEKIYEAIKNTGALIVETDKSSTIYGSPIDVLTLYAKMTHNILEHTIIQKKELKKAFETGVKVFEKGMENVQEERKDNYDKLISKIEKLVNILKELEKDEK